MLPNTCPVNLGNLYRVKYHCYGAIVYQHKPVSGKKTAYGLAELVKFVVCPCFVKSWYFSVRSFVLGTKSRIVKKVFVGSDEFLLHDFLGEQETVVFVLVKKAHFERLNHAGLSYESVLGSNLEPS